MAGLVRQVTGLSHRPRPADVSSGIHGQHRVVVRTGRARPGRVIVAAAHVAARPKYCRLRGAAANAVPETSRQLLDQQEVRPSNDTASNPLITTIRKDRFFEIEMEVRDDELDEYGVVNNAIYASYLHSGRDVMLEQLGISVDYWTSTGNAMALSELNLKYFAPLRSGDKFAVKVKPIQIKGVRIIVEHMIETLPHRKLVLEGRATAVCLNKDFRPTRVFPELSASFIEVFSCKVA
ncbi:acyl-acyl carrier protein thioesterase ATL4, chloroplastic [Setaria italica]|nr:acyl-acyl carrier protein thioesterase ATL4, chloroplastic [Setaria italica]